MKQWKEAQAKAAVSHGVFSLIELGYPPARETTQRISLLALRLEETKISSRSSDVNGVFQLSPNQQGGWDSELIYSDSFVQGGLAIDGADNLYGIDADFVIGQGNVFKISLSQATLPQINIYIFKGSQGLPIGPPAIDSAGNVYGTTLTGGAKNLGTVWKLTLVTTGKKEGTYTKKILHTFTAEKSGQYPESGVLLDSSGNIYSATFEGGGSACPGGCGTLFALVPNGETYKYKLLRSFNGADGASPEAAKSMILSPIF